MPHAHLPCPGCQRHVRTTERVCPFCSGAVTALAPAGSDVRDAPRRAARFALAVGATLSLGACRSEPASPPTRAVEASPTAVAAPDNGPPAPDNRPPPLPPEGILDGAPPELPADADATADADAANDVEAEAPSRAGRRTLYGGPPRPRRPR